VGCIFVTPRTNWFVCLLFSLAVAGCGARAPHSLGQPAPPKNTGSVPGPAAAAPGSLADFIAQVRARTSEARPPERPQVARVEATDPRLAAAIVAAKTFPSPETLRRLAAEYERLHIADRAHDYLHQAMVLDPRDAATYVALARLWRNGGLYNLALGDAHRAVYYAPSSALAHNTLGTVFQALGYRQEAQKRYERALQLDPAAAYALNNLCYGWILNRQATKAVAACDAALKLDPHLAAARNNLGLAYAALGDLDASRAAFAKVGDEASASYNLGIIYMARRQYPDAVTAFAAAQQARPSFGMATVRAEQAGKLAQGGAD
jgi:tetratricopeptide (TPR) repeat protein